MSRIILSAFLLSTPNAAKSAYEGGQTVPHAHARAGGYVQGWCPIICMYIYSTSEGWQK